MEKFKNFITIEKNLNLKPDILMNQSKLNRLMFDQMRKFTQEDNSVTLLEFIFENAYDHNDWDTIRVSDFFSRMYNTIDQLQAKDFEIKIYLILLFKRNVKSEIQFFFELMDFFSEFKNFPDFGILNLNQVEIYKSEFKILHEFFSNFGDLNQKFAAKTTCPLSVVIFEILSLDLKCDSINSIIENSSVIPTALRKGKLHRSILKVRIMVKLERGVNKGRILRHKIFWTQKLVDLNSIMGERNTSLEFITEELKTDFIKHFSNNEYENLISLTEGISRALKRTRNEFHLFVKGIDKAHLPHLIQLLELKQKSDLNKMKFEVDNYERHIQDLKGISLRLNTLAKDVLFTHFLKLIVLMKIEADPEHKWPEFERNEKLDKYIFGFLKKAEFEIKNDFKKLIEKREAEIEEIFQKIKKTQFMDDFVDYFKSKVHKIGPQTRFMNFFSSERKSARISKELLVKSVITRKTQQMPDFDKNLQNQSSLLPEDVLFSSINTPFVGSLPEYDYGSDINQAMLDYVSKQSLINTKEKICLENFDVYLDSIIGIGKSNPSEKLKIERNRYYIETSNLNLNEADDQNIELKMSAGLDFGQKDFIEFPINVPQKVDLNSSFKPVDDLSRTKSKEIINEVPIINIKCSVSRSGKIQEPPIINLNFLKRKSNSKNLEVLEPNLDSNLVQGLSDLKKSQSSRLSNPDNIGAPPRLQLDRLSKLASNLNLNFKKSKTNFQFDYKQVSNKVENNNDYCIPEGLNSRETRQMAEGNVVFNPDHRISEKLRFDLLKEKEQEFENDRQDSSLETEISRRISKSRQPGPGCIQIRKSLIKPSINFPIGLDITPLKRNTIVGEVKPPKIKMGYKSKGLNPVPKFEYTPRPSLCRETEYLKAPLIYLTRSLCHLDQTNAPYLDLRKLQGNTIKIQVPKVLDPEKSPITGYNLSIPEFNPKDSKCGSSDEEPLLLSNRKDVIVEGDEFKTTFNNSNLELKSKFNDQQSNNLEEVENLIAPKIDWRPKKAIKKGLDMIPNISLVVRSSLVRSTNLPVVDLFRAIGESANLTLNKESKRHSFSNNKTCFIDSSIEQCKSLIMGKKLGLNDDTLESPRKTITINRNGNREIQAPVIPVLKISQKSNSFLGRVPNLSLRSIKQATNLVPPAFKIVFKCQKAEQICAPKIDIKRSTDAITKYNANKTKNLIPFNENNGSGFFNPSREDCRELSGNYLKDSESENLCNPKKLDKRNSDKVNEKQRQTHLLELENFHRSTLKKDLEESELLNEVHVKDIMERAEKEMRFFQSVESELLETSTMFLNMELEKEDMIVDLQRHYNEYLEFLMINSTIDRDKDQLEAPKFKIFEEPNMADLQQAPKIKLNLEFLKIKNEKMQAPKIQTLNMKSKESENVPILKLDFIRNYHKSMPDFNIEMPPKDLALRFLKKKTRVYEESSEDLRMSSISEENEIKNRTDANFQPNSAWLCGQPIIKAPQLNLKKSFFFPGQLLIPPDLSNSNKTDLKQLINSTFVVKIFQLNSRIDTPANQSDQRNSDINSRRGLDFIPINPDFDFNPINSPKYTIQKLNISTCFTENKHPESSLIPMMPANLESKPRDNKKNKTLNQRWGSQCRVNDLNPPNINIHLSQKKGFTLETPPLNLNFIDNNRRNSNKSMPIGVPSFSFEATTRFSRAINRNQKVPVAPKHINIRSSFFENDRKPKPFLDSHQQTASNSFILISKDERFIDKEISESRLSIPILKQEGDKIDEVKIDTVKPFVQPNKFKTTRFETDYKISNHEDPRETEIQSYLKNDTHGIGYLNPNSRKSIETFGELSKQTPLSINNHEINSSINYDGGLKDTNPSYQGTEVNFLHKCLLVFSIFNSKMLKKSNQKKSDLFPSKRFTKVNWSPIENRNIPGSIWEQIKNFRQKINLPQICELFEDKSTQIVDLIRGKERKEFMDLQTANIFGSEYQDFPKLFKQLWTLDFQKSDAGFINNLLLIVPKNNEILDVAEIGNRDISHLSLASKWVLVSSSVPHLEIRLQSYLLKQNIDERVNFLNNCLDIYIKICHEILEKREFQYFLKTCIEAGNQLNLNSEFPQIIGFKLSTINALIDCGSLKQITLLDYLIYEFSVQDRGIYDSLKDLVVGIDRIGDFPLNAITDEILKMKSILNEVRLVLEESDNTEFKDLFFISNFKPMFIKHARLMIELENKAVIVNDLLGEVVMYLGEDESVLDSNLVKNELLKILGNGLKESFDCQI